MKMTMRFLRSCISLVWVCVLASRSFTTGQDCSRYHLVNETHRSTKYVLNPATDIPLCDTVINERQWYRFKSYAGDKIPERNPPDTVPMNRCGTNAPMYIKGVGCHPITDSLTLPAQVCANYGQGGDNCNWQTTIDIHKCPAVGNEPSFYIYKLRRPQGCSVAYCAGEDVVCDPGYMWNGKECVNTFPAMSGFPLLSGPNTTGVGLATQLFFRCTVQYQPVTGTDAWFLITFLFNGDPMDNLTLPYTSLGGFRRQGSAQGIYADLSEKYLQGRLGKEIRCKVQSYWAGSDVYSEEMLSQTGYFAGLTSVASSYDFDFSKGSTQTIPFISTLPLTCLHCDVYNCDCVYIFRVQSDVASQCSLIWSEGKDLGMKVHIVAETLDGRTVYQLNFQPYDDDLFQRSSSLWHGYVIPSVPILPVPEPISYKKCNSWGDPHITTFDGFYFDNYMIGDFVLTSAINNDQGIHMEIQVRQATCWKVTCNCAIIVRERNSIYRVSRPNCGQADWLYDAGATSAVQLLKQDPYDGSELYRDGSGKKFSIRMPSGLRVEIDSTNRWLGIDVYIPKVYWGSTSQTSFCGNSNGLKNDDPISNANNYRIPSNTQNYFTEEPQCSSLYYPEALTCTCEKPTTAYCTDSIENAGLKIKSPAQQQVTRTLTSGLVCTEVKPVFPADNGTESEDGDYALDPNDLYTEMVYDPVFGVNLTFTWPTPKGKTKEEVERYCRDELASSLAHGQCEAIAEIDTIVFYCVADMQIADEYLPMTAYINMFEGNCLNTLAAGVNNGSTPSADIESVYNSVCPNQCNGRGQCRNATCFCDEGFRGADCSVDATKPPTLTGILRNGLCDFNERPCTTVVVFATNIATDELKCRFTDPSTGLSEQTNGTLLTGSDVSCPVPLGFRRSKTDLPAIRRTTISLTNDGSSYSNNVEFISYDSKCLNCSQTNGCDLQADTCSIDNRCYVNGDISPDQRCSQCLPAQSTNSWVDRTVINDWSSCTRSCDLGAQTRDIVCAIDNSVISTEDQLCKETDCPDIAEEQYEGVIITMFEVDLISVMETPTSILSDVASAVNDYCSVHYTECCLSVEISGGTRLTRFTSSELCSYASGYPFVDDIDGEIKVIVKIKTQDVRLQCVGASEPSSADDKAYADSNILLAAVSDAKEGIEGALNITITSISKPTPGPTTATSS